MEPSSNLDPAPASFGLPLFTTPFAASAHAPASDKTIVSRTSEIDGVKLHYLTAGQGPALILLHGYAETSLMWRPIMLGHDIGLMVAYAYAAQFPAWAGGRRCTTARISGTSALMVRHRKRWFRDVSAPTSNISGMTWPPTG